MSDGDAISRRAFLRALGAVAAGAAVDRVAIAGDAPAPLPTRALGKTGARVPIIGLGGWHIGVGAEKDGLELIRRAVDAGVTFLDNAADYHAGVSEERVGKALAGGKLRDGVFLMTKCCDHERTRAGSLRGLEESLRRLRTDRLDLYQLHAILEPDEPAKIFAKGGAIEAIEEAKRKGLVRFVGFTGHKDPRVFLEMLKHDFPWDAVQLPLSPADPHHRSFEKEILPLLVEKGIGVIGMKALASGTLPASGVVTAAECRRYALSLPISTLVCGIDSVQVLEQDLAVARRFEPMQLKEREALVAKVAQIAAGGKLEGYKLP
jgi:uncharacterized protein